MSDGSLYPEERILFLYDQDDNQSQDSVDSDPYDGSAISSDMSDKADEDSIFLNPVVVSLTDSCHIQDGDIVLDIEDCTNLPVVFKLSWEGKQLFPEDIILHLQGHSGEQLYHSTVVVIQDSLIINNLTLISKGDTTGVKRISLRLDMLRDSDAERPTPPMLVNAPALTKSSVQSSLSKPVPAVIPSTSIDLSGKSALPLVPRSSSTGPAVPPSIPRPAGPVLPSRPAGPVLPSVPRPAGPVPPSIPKPAGPVTASLMSQTRGLPLFMKPSQTFPSEGEGDGPFFKKVTVETKQPWVPFTEETYISCGKQILLPDKGWYNMSSGRKTSTMGKATITSMRVTADSWQLIDSFLLCNDVPLDKLTEAERTEIEAEREKTEQREILSITSSFKFAGMSVWGTITEITDADTVKAEVEITSYDLTRTGVVITSDQFSMKIKLIIRCMGYDAAESKTKAGHVITQYVSELLKGKRVFFRLMGSDMYGRTLAYMYESKEKSVCYNKLICEYINPEYGICAVPYSGGTKNKVFVKKTGEGTFIEIEDLL